MQGSQAAALGLLQKGTTVFPYKAMSANRWRNITRNGRPQHIHTCLCAADTPFRAHGGTPSGHRSPAASPSAPRCATHRACETQLRHSQMSHGRTRRGGQLEAKGSVGGVPLKKHWPGSRSPATTRPVQMSPVCPFSKPSTMSAVNSPDQILRLMRSQYLSRGTMADDAKGLYATALMRQFSPRLWNMARATGADGM